MLAVLVSTMSSRLTGFGLNDLGAAVGASIDERAWITTSFSAAQMLIGPLSAWLAFVFGARRVLLIGAMTFGVCEWLIPFAHGLEALLVLQFVAGLGSGTFVPLAIGVVLANMPKRLWLLGISVYAMNLELTLNLAATLEGWHIDHGGWRWIFWQNLPIVALLIGCVHYGLPRQDVKKDEQGKGDYWGMLTAGTGFSLLFAALDQGNRLDWGSSGLVIGLSFGAALMLSAFFIHEWKNADRGIDLRFLSGRNVAVMLLLLIIVRLLVLTSNVVVPNFLTQVAGFRPQQVGDVLIWVAVPQLLVGPALGLALRRVDARLLLGVGMLLIMVASIMASRLTSTWSEAEFIPSMLVQGVGQTVVLTSLLYFFVLHLTPGQVLTFGAIVQAVRLFGGELAIAFVQTFTRKASQMHSNFLGQHVASGATEVSGRLMSFAGGPLSLFGTGDPLNASRGLALLSGQVARQAATLAYADAFRIATVAATLGVLMACALRPPPAL
jgi:DHA2 family multidrug resistance protein